MGCPALALFGWPAGVALAPRFFSASITPALGRLGMMSRSKAAPNGPDSILVSIRTGFQL